jgi:TPR repeat protein
MVGIAQTLAGCATFEPTTLSLADGTIQSSSQRCGNIASEHRVSPDYWMDRAAGLGDPRAMLHYGLNAQRRLSDPNTSSEQRNEVAKRAHAYLFDAARAGVREAFLLLIDAYRSGWYGPVDVEEAAAYLIALAELSPDSVNPEAAESFLAGLCMHERSNAARRAKEIVASL